MEYASMEENIYYFGVQSIMKRKLENQYGVLKKNYIMCYQLCHQLIELRSLVMWVVLENFVRCVLKAFNYMDISANIWLCKSV